MTSARALLLTLVVGGLAGCYIHSHPHPAPPAAAAYPAHAAAHHGPPGASAYASACACACACACSSPGDYHAAADELPPDAWQHDDDPADWLE
jgi:hypothetical protein